MFLKVKIKSQSKKTGKEDRNSENPVACTCACACECECERACWFVCVRASAPPYPRSHEARDTQHEQIPQIDAFRLSLVWADAATMCTSDARCWTQSIGQYVTRLRMSNSFVKIVFHCHQDLACSNQRSCFAKLFYIVSVEFYFKSFEWCAHSRHLS